MAEEGQQQQTQQTAPAGSGNGPAQNPPPARPTPRRRATDVAPVQMDAGPIAEAVAGAVKSVLEEVFGKQEQQQQGNTGEGQQQQGNTGQGNTGEQKPKRRGSWFWGGPK